MSEVTVGEVDKQDDQREEAERRANCRDLARSGEAMCKTGDVSGGIAQLEKALAVGTNDLKLKSIICSQLGNAYIDMGEYQKAVEKHQEDRALSTVVKDTAGEAKACCNLSCAYRLLELYEEAIDFSEQCVQLCRRLHDKEKEGLAMYSLATCYHSMAKKSHLIDGTEPDRSSNMVATHIVKAVQHYLYFLKLLDDISKPPAYNTLRGRTYGNLGNLYYLLNNMDDSVLYHRKRLEIAVMDNDVEAILRAHSNIANAHLVGGNPTEAEKHYMEMHTSAEKISNKVCLVKALFGLATSHSIRKNYPKALNYYLQMQKLVQEQQDEDGQLKVLFGLTYANRALGRFEEARDFALQHYQLASQMGDTPSMELAQGNVEALSELLRKQGESEKEKGHKRAASVKAIRRVSGDQKRESLGRKSLPPMLSAIDGQCYSEENSVPPIAKNLSSESSIELFSALEKGSRGRMDEQRAEAPTLVTPQKPRHNTIDVVVLPRKEKSSFTASLRMERPRTRSDANDHERERLTAIGESPRRSARKLSPRGTASPCSDSPLSSGSTSSRRSVLSDLRSQMPPCDSTESMGLTDFLTFLDGQVPTSIELRPICPTVTRRSRSLEPMSCSRRAAME